MKCPDCGRDTCAYEHFRMDISPAAMRELRDAVDRSIGANFGASGELVNFSNQLHSRLQRWEQADTLGDLI